VQQEIVDEFGRKNKGLASKALYNIGVIHESARRFPEAVAAYEEVIKRYGKEDVAVQAQFDIGVLYENQTKFAEAAEAFIKMKAFTKNDAMKDKSTDALRNAGLIYEALERYEEAADTFALYIKTFPKEEDVPQVAFHAAEVQERKGDAKAYAAAAKSFEKVARTYGRKDKQYQLRATAAAGVAYKKADKKANRRKATLLFMKALQEWVKLNEKEPEKVEPSTKAYAGLCSLELAEYTYDDYAALSIRALNNKGKFSVSILKATLIAKAEALAKTQKAFDKVLAFKDPGNAAAAAFRLGLLYYEFSESLFNADVPPGLTEEQVDEYRYQLEEVAAPIQEKALKAFTAALNNALEKDVYNKWSRLSAQYASKVNPDEFPLPGSRLKPNRTKDTLQSTSFIRAVRRGDTVVDFTGEKKTGKKKPGAKAETAKGADDKAAGAGAAGGK
jgi:TolA-binding protein